MPLNRVVLRAGVLSAILASGGGTAEAQSTSPWVLVSDKTQIPVDPAAPTSPNLGATYLNAEFLIAQVYQKSNWCTGIVEKNRQAVLDVTVTGKIGSIAISDTRAILPIQLRTRPAVATFGWRGMVVERMPTTYQVLQLKMRVSKTADDGLQGLLNTLTDITKETPAITVSQSAQGIVSGVKAVADYLFNKNLLQQRLSSDLQFPSAGNSLPAGYYVTLASDDINGYSLYLDPGANSGKDLEWTGSQLMYKSKPITDVSYFVVHVTYQNLIFDKPLNSLAFAGIKPWASLFQVGRRKAEALANLADRDKLADEIRGVLSDGRTLIDAEPDLIQQERDDIFEAVRADAQAKLNARAVALTPASTPKPADVVLSPPADSEAAKVLEEANKKPLIFDTKTIDAVNSVQ